MKIVFMGTPDFAVPTLIKLVGKHDVAAVLTQPDRPKGRGQKMQYSPVKEIAVQNNIPVYQPVKLRKDIDAINALKDINPDVIIVIAFGQILPKEVLEIPKYGCINVHASLLPELRGAAPINWAIIRGYKKTGITTMQMNEGLDTGDILLMREIEIEETETAEELHDRLMMVGADLLIETLDKIERGSVSPRKQEDEKSSYAPMLNKELGHIDWRNDCYSIYNLVRGVTSWPGAYAFYKGNLLKIWRVEKDTKDSSPNPGEIVDVSKNGIRVACGKGSIIIKDIQEIGSKRMDVSIYLNGHTIAKGNILE